MRRKVMKMKRIDGVIVGYCYCDRLQKFVDEWPINSSQALNPWLTDQHQEVSMNGLRSLYWTIPICIWEESVPSGYPCTPQHNVSGYRTTDSSSSPPLRPTTVWIAKPRFLGKSWGDSHHRTLNLSGWWHAMWHTSQKSQWQVMPNYFGCKAITSILPTRGDLQDDDTSRHLRQVCTQHGTWRVLINSKMHMDRTRDHQAGYGEAR